MKETAQRENIATAVIVQVVVSSLCNLGSRIARSSTANKHIGLLILVLGQPEVDEHRLVGVLRDLSHHDIFGFDVSVHDAAFMQNADSNADLVEVPLEKLFRLVELEIEEIKKVDAQSLHDDVH